MANTLKAGFGRVNVNPMMGIGISGYFIPRYAEGSSNFKAGIAELIIDEGKKLLAQLNETR